MKFYAKLLTHEIGPWTWIPYNSLSLSPVLALDLVVRFDLLDGDDLVDALLTGDGHVVDVHLDRGRGRRDGTGRGRCVMNVGDSRDRNYKKCF